MSIVLILILAAFCVIGYFNKKLAWFSLPVAIGIFIVGTILIILFKNVMVWIIYVLGLIAIIFTILIILSRLQK